MSVRINIYAVDAESLLDKSSDTSIDLQNFLKQHVTSDWVRQISNGHRRWWIGSFLESLERTIGKNNEQYNQMESLFKRILGSYNCGTSISASETHISNYSDLSFIPKGDTDLHMAIWNADEITFFLNMVSILSKAKFTRPSYKVGISPNTDDEWNEWVRTVLNDLRKLEQLPFSDPILVTFIDS